MNNINIKTYLIVGAVVGLGGIAFAIYLLFFSGQPTPNPATSNIEKYPANIQKVLNNPVEKQGSWSTLQQRDSYFISYDSVSDVFAIDLLKQPVVENSKSAEQELMALLGINQEYACKLRISIKVPNSVDESASGYEFGPSFCPSVKHIESFATPQTNQQDNNNFR